MGLFVATSGHFVPVAMVSILERVDCNVITMVSHSARYKTSGIIAPVLPTLAAVLSSFAFYFHFLPLFQVSTELVTCSLRLF